MSKVSTSTIFTLASHKIIYKKNYHPENEAELWYNVFQSIVYTGFRVIPSASAFIYYISMELLMIYDHSIFKQIELLLKNDNELIGKTIHLDSNFERIVYLAKTFSVLNQASHYLQSRMGLILLINCIYVFINSFMNLFYMIWRLQKGWIGYFDISGIHIANFIEISGRFFLLCHATDRLNSSVRNCSLNCSFNCLMH